jgi:hypothetical protein
MWIVIGVALAVVFVAAVILEQSRVASAAHTASGIDSRERGLIICAQCSCGTLG